MPIKTEDEKAKNKPIIKKEKGCIAQPFNPTIPHEYFTKTIDTKVRGAPCLLIITKTQSQFVSL